MAAGDIATVLTVVSGNGGAPTYLQNVITATLNGATAVELVLLSGQPIKGGSLLLTLTGGTDTQTITVSVRPTAVPAASLTANNVVFSGTAVVGTDGATTLAYKVFAFPTSGITFPPGSYTFRIVSSGATNAIAVCTLLMQSMP